jgi:hypothetical protein
LVKNQFMKIGKRKPKTSDFFIYHLIFRRSLIQNSNIE